MRELIVNKNDAGQRLDKFLGKAVKNLPSSLLYKSIRTKKIKVNRKRATIDQILCEGDSILLFISDEFFDDTASHVQLKLTPRIDVVYEDENIILVNKRPGMLTHPDDNEQQNTLIDHITTSERSVNTLSGGEAFLASLALALGLSDEVQMSTGIRLDTLFVDEGFGSLDSEALNKAYHTLAGLTEGNRLVGIISHVPELKEKIDRQIVVTKDKVVGSYVTLKI